VRGDQYAVALGLLENGEIVVGVLGCPNLPITSIAHGVPKDSNEPVGCLFTASKGAGTFVQSLDGKLQPQQVCRQVVFYFCAKLKWQSQSRRLCERTPSGESTG